MEEWMMTSREALRLLVQALTDQTEEELRVSLNPMVADMMTEAKARRSEDLDDRFLVQVHTVLICTDDPSAQHYDSLKRVIEAYLMNQLSLQEALHELGRAGFTFFPRPTPQMVADDLVRDARARAQERDQDWVEPISSVDSDGDIVLEWLTQDGERRLTIFIDPHAQATYLRAWGPNIHTQMQEGGLESVGHLLALLKTLEEPMPNE